MRPPKLQMGDSIGIFSSSTPATVFAKARYDRAKQFLVDKGFKIVEGSLTGKSDFYRSGSIVDRAFELNELIKNPEVKCIISSIGGMNSNSILPYIDYQQLIKTPKIIIGYSDITAILLAIYAKTGINTFYGPAVIPSFGELEPFLTPTYNYFKNMLIDNIKLPFVLQNPEFWTEEYIPWGEDETPKSKQKNSLATLNHGKATGRLIGGNLNTLEGIWGSQYMPEIVHGDILFIEDSLKDIATVERSFSLLKINGVFDRIGGLLIGKHELFDNKSSGRKYYEVLLEVLGECKIPILAEFDCCHTKPMLTLPIGSSVELDATNQSVTIVEY